MMLKNQKKLASEVSGAGIDRVRLVPERVSEIKEAITREDIRALIKSGAIIISPSKGTSKARARARHAQRKRGRQRGHGKRKGAQNARMPSKLVWMRKIRLMRQTLQQLRSREKITQPTFKDMYRKAKGGFFRDRGHMLFYLEQNKLMK